MFGLVAANRTIRATWLNRNSSRSIAASHCSKSPYHWTPNYTCDIYKHQGRNVKEYYMQT